MFRIKCVECDQIFSNDDKDHLICDACFAEMNRDESAIVEGCECGERNCMCPYFDVEPRIGRDQMGNNVTRYMTDYEKEMLEAMQDLNRLKIEVRKAEKWIDYAKDTIETMQSTIFTLEEKYGRA